MSDANQFNHLNTNGVAVAAAVAVAQLDGLPLSNLGFTLRSVFIEIGV